MEDGLPINAEVPQTYMEEESDWEATEGSTDLSDSEESCNESSEQEDGDETCQPWTRRVRRIS